MTTKPNLRFFLALGNTKMVLLEENNQVAAYTSPLSTHKGKISARRVKEAVSAR